MAKKQSGSSKVKEVILENPSEQPDTAAPGNGANADILLRLRKVEGQIRGLQKMIEDGKDLADIINQIAAIRKAINKAGIIMITDHLQTCLADTQTNAKAKDKALDESMKQFLTLA